MSQQVDNTGPCVPTATAAFMHAVANWRIFMCIIVPVNSTRDALAGYCVNDQGAKCNAVSRFKSHRPLTSFKVDLRGMRGVFDPVVRVKQPGFEPDASMLHVRRYIDNHNATYLNYTPLSVSRSCVTVNCHEALICHCALRRSHRNVREPPSRLSI